LVPTCVARSLGGSLHGVNIEGGALPIPGDAAC